MSTTSISIEVLIVCLVLCVADSSKQKKLFSKSDACRALSRRLHHDSIARARLRAQRLQNRIVISVKSSSPLDGAHSTVAPVSRSERNAFRVGLVFVSSTPDSHGRGRTHIKADARACKCTRPVHASNARASNNQPFFFLFACLSCNR